MENKGKQFKGSGIKKYIKEDWEDDLGEEREDVVEYVISFEPGEYYDEYQGEFITDDKDEADDLFDELKEEHKLDQVSQYIEKTWEWDRINEEYYETDVDVYFNAGDELEFYGESKKIEGYSLGDDKESFDVYKHTAEFLNKVGKELEELGWKYNKETYKFEKEDITIDMEAIQDNVNDLYIGSNKLKLSSLVRDYSSYEDIGEDTGIIYYVSTKADDYDARQLASKINSCEKLDENKEVKTESLGDRYEVWQNYYEDGRTTTEYVMSFDNYAEAQRFASGLMQDPDCEAWVKDKEEESKKVTESEIKVEDKQDNGISLSEAENKCKEVEKLLAEKLPDYNWLVNISAGQIIISDLNSKSDFRYTKKNGWGKSQKQVEDIVSQVFGTTATLDFYDSDVWAKHKAIVKGINILLPTNESEEKVDYSKFTPTNKVLSGNKGLSEDKIDEMRWALPDLFKDMTDEQKQIFEELSLREMVMSCLVYGDDIHTAENNVSLGKYRGKPYVAEYYDTLGKDVTEKIIKQQTDYFNRGKVIRDVGTDSEGVTYNSFEEPEEENKKVTEAKQVNNMKINYNKIYDKFDVITPDGRALEEFDTEEEAIKWAKEQKDFISKKTEAVENLKIGDVVIVTPFDDDLYSSIYTDSEGKYTGRAAGVIYDLYNGKCDIVNVGIVDLYLDENNNYTGKYKFDTNFEHNYYTTLKGVSIKSRKVELVTNNDLKDDILYRYDIVMNSKSAPKEVLKFQQTTDSRYDKDAYMLLQKRLKELENKLNIKGVKFDYSEPSWIPGDGYDQWVSNCTVKKTAKNITWENIYEIVNSIKAVPYKLVVESKKTEAKPEEADKEIWEKVEKIVDTADNEIGPDQSNEYEYDEHIKFVIYRDFEFEDIFEVYTYLDGEAQGELDTGDVHLEDLDATMVDIVKKLQSKENLTETKYGDSNPDKIVPDAYCEIEKTNNGYYINCGIGTHTDLGSGNFTIYPEDFVVDLYGEVKSLAKEKKNKGEIKRVKDNIKDLVPMYNELIPEYNANIESMIKNLTPFAEKSKQGQLTRTDLDSIEEITGRVSPNRMSTLPEFNWNGKFGKLISFIGKLEIWRSDLASPLSRADTITITESIKMEANMTTNKVIVYQIQETANCSYLFMDYDFAVENGGPDMNDYKKVAEVEIDTRDTDVTYVLDEVFTYGNTNIEYYDDNPEARSISVSDILEYNGDKYYVDSFGFKKLDDIEDTLTEASVTKFQTLTVDKDGNEMLLKDTSYNHACSWLEKELAKAGSKVVDTETKGNKTIIKADNKTKFEYDEEKGTLKRLEEAEVKRNNSKKKLDYKLDGFKGVNIIVVDKKNNIDTEDYMKFDSMEFGIDEYEFKDSMIDGIKDILTDIYEFTDDYYDDRFTTDEITEMAEDITQDVLQLYDDLPEENIDRENGIANLGESKKVEAKDLYGEWIDLLDKIPANRLEDYKIEYDLYDEQLNGDEKPTEMILPKLIAGAKKYIKSEKVEAIDPKAVKEKVEKAKADIGLKKAEEMIDTEKELTEGIKKEIIQYAKQQGLDVEKLQKQGQLDSVAEALDNIVGEMVSKTAVEYMDTTGKDIEWDFDISNNDIQVIIQ